ncbi:MAG TPA: hypothetical protein VG734_27325 [Lacunisphaera sp.]|nr:hypothetical protein [Lacunisphaera sp.]
MNSVEYLIVGLLVVMAIGIWVLIDATRKAEDAFENELGFQFGIAPPVTSLDSLPDLVPTPPPPAVVPDPATSKPRRPPGSKPPMLPANMTAADFATNAPWQPAAPANPAPTSPESESPASNPSPDATDTPTKQ